VPLPEEEASRTNPLEEASKMEGVDKAQKLRLEGNDFYRKHDLQKALEKWHEAARYNPGDPRIHNNCAQAYRLLGDFQKSLECAESAVARAISADAKIVAKAYYNRAQALRELGKVMEAAEDFERAQDLDPSVIPALQQSTKKSSHQGEACCSAPRDCTSANDDDPTMRVSGTPASRESSYVHVAAGPAEPGVGDISGVATGPLEPSAGRDASGIAGDVSAPSLPSTEGASIACTGQAHQLAGDLAKQLQKKQVSEIPIPRTSSDFRTVCKSLKGDASALSEYVQRILPATYRRLFKSDLDTIVLESFAEVLLHRVKSDPEWCKACLKSLQGVERYALQRAMSSSLGKKLSEVESAIGLR
jgi:hypothetical protein